MSDSIKILFCGDFVAHNSDKIIVSPDLLLLFKTSDINCCNFEAPVESNGEPIAKSGSVLFQSRNSPEFLEKTGFNLVQLANNHIFDYGHSGYEETVTLFKSSLLVGARNLAEAYKIKTITLKGKTIGFLALTHYEFGVLGREAKSNEYGTAWINHPIVNTLIIDAKKQLDYLFILPHAGIEMIDAPLPEWRSRYKEFIDLEQMG